MDKRTVEHINYAMGLYLDRAKEDMKKKEQELNELRTEMASFLGQRHNDMNAYEIVDKYNDYLRYVDMKKDFLNDAINLVQSIEDSIEEFNQMTGGEF